MSDELIHLKYGAAINYGSCIDYVVENEIDSRTSGFLLKKNLKDNTYSINVWGDEEFSEQVLDEIAAMIKFFRNYQRS